MSPRDDVLSLAPKRRHAIVTAEQAGDPDHFLGLRVAVPLGIQHVLAMFVSNLTPAIIVGARPGSATDRRIRAS